jgi:selenide,water dikinase
MTDVTGWSAWRGHALEMARGSGLSVQLHRANAPPIDGAEASAAAGAVAGRASGRSRAAYGGEIALPAGLRRHTPGAAEATHETSGGLLVSCAPEALEEVLAIFHGHGFAQAAMIGDVREAGAAQLVVR